MSGGSPQDDTQPQRWRRWARGAVDGVIIGAPTAAFLDVAAQNSGTGLGLFGAIAAFVSFSGLSYWRIGRATGRVDDDFRSGDPMGGATPAARRTAAGAVAALAIGAAGAGVAVPALIPLPTPVTVPVSEGLAPLGGEIEDAKERTAAALRELGTQRPYALQNLRKIIITADRVEVVYRDGNDSQLHSSATGESTMYAGALYGADFAMAAENVPELDQLADNVALVFDELNPANDGKASIARIELEMGSFPTEVGEVPRLVATVTGADSGGGAQQVEADAYRLQIADIYSTIPTSDTPLTLQSNIESILTGMSVANGIDVMTPVLTEVGVSGLDGHPAPESVPATGAVYLQTAEGTAWKMSGLLDVYNDQALPDNLPAERIQLGALLAVLPQVLEDHRSRVGASDEDNPFFAMRVTADPADPLVGIVLDYTSLDGAALRYSLDGSYLGPVPT